MNCHLICGGHGVKEEGRGGGDPATPPAYWHWLAQRFSWWKCLNLCLHRVSWSAFYHLIIAMCPVAQCGRRSYMKSRHNTACWIRSWELFRTNQSPPQGPFFRVWIVTQTAACAQVGIPGNEWCVHFLSSLNALTSRRDSSGTCYPSVFFFTLCPHLTRPLIVASDEDRKKQNGKCTTCFAGRSHAEK